jgi:Flp pilus assembly protein TadG
MATAAQRLRGLTAREEGIAATEFGLVAPVFLLLLLGMFDLAHMTYARAIFEGAVEQAARNSSLEGADTTVADNMVKDRVKTVLPGVTVVATRKSYFDFADISRPEKYTDGNGNNTCDNGEAYVDENNSGSWEPDIGQSGNGGSGDVVMYTVTATYKPVIKVPFMPSSWSTNNRTLTATAIKKNQPFGQQTAYTTKAGTCT